MIITAIRHTSVDVPSGICYGMTDVPLAPSFPEELERIRQNLGSLNVDAVFSSPLGRCTKLATELFPEGQLRIDHRLTELNFGDWEMTSWKSIYESEAGKEWFANYVNTRGPNGESFIDLIHRAESFFNDLKKNDLPNIVIFTHAGIIRAMMCLLQDKTPEEAFDTPLEYGKMITFNLGNE